MTNLPTLPKTADTPSSPNMDTKSVEAFFDKLAAGNNAPKTELHYKNTFELLIAVILSAQATDKSVNQATGPLFARCNTPEALGALSQEALEGYIKSIGLYRTKAKNVLATCQRLCTHYNGQVPDTQKDLMSLAGVGRKTANVVLNTAFGKPTIAVDTHIFRVCNRTGLAPGINVQRVEDALIQRTPKRHLMDAHHHLILHGRYTCKARMPLCGACPVYQECNFEHKETFATR